MSGNTEKVTRVGMEPVHPGELLKQILEGDEDNAPVAVLTAAKALGVSRQTLHRVLAGTSPVTVDLARRIGLFAGNGPGLWLRMQSAYDLWHAEHSAAKPEVVPITEARKSRASSMERKKAPLMRAAAKRAPRRAKARARGRG